MKKKMKMSTPIRLTSNLYILDGHTPKKATEEEWIRWSSKSNNRRVAQDIIKDINISTVFLTVEHGFSGGHPIIFETMVFGGEWDEYQERYCSWDKALKGHKIMVAKVKKSLEKK